MPNRNWVCGAPNAADAFWHLYRAKVEAARHSWPPISAISWAPQARRYLLIDLNLQFGEAVLTVHDRKATSDIAEVARNLSRLDASFLSASTVQVTSEL